MSGTAASVYLTEGEKRERESEARRLGLSLSQYMVRASCPASAALIPADEYLRAMRRSDNEPRSMVLMRAPDLTDGTDASGLIASSVEGVSLLALVQDSRPALQAANLQQVSPDQGQFERWLVTGLPTSAAQSAQGAELSTGELEVTPNPVTMTTHGTAARIAEQVFDWGAGSNALQQVADAFALAYGLDTEHSFCAAVEAKVTTNVVDADSVTMADDIIDAVAAAQVALVESAGVPGSVLYGGVDLLSAFTAYRDPLPPLFPQLVFSSAFSDDFVAVGVPRLLEAYEAPKGFARVQQPSTVGFRVSYSGYLGLNLHAEGLCGLAVSS